MSSQVIIDSDVCIASEMCIGSFPGAFALNADGVAQPLPGERTLTEADRRELAAQCPSGALRLVETERRPA